MHQPEFDFSAVHEAHERKIHQNSIDSYHSIKDLATRRQAVLDVYKTKQAALTDRQVANILGSSHVCVCQPRISELVESGALIELKHPETGENIKTKCPVTGKSVRLCVLSEMLN